MKNLIVNEDRLRKLAIHLLSDECKDTLYVLAPFRQDGIQTEVNVAELPALESAISESYKIYPNEWNWDDENEIAFLKADFSRDPSTSAKMFYGLDDGMFRHLFVPMNQAPLIYGGTRLEALITPGRIGKNIYDFLRRYKIVLN
jgi:hypothetical protein